MHILLTNDDGVYAPGLFALAQSLAEIGEVTIVAPDRNWSASGHVKTMHRPLRVNETNLRDGTLAYSTDGAPSDCVALALLGLVEKEIDLVVSGINPLANVGHDVTYSGTVTAAMEAAICGVPGFACSIDPPEGYKGDIDYRTVASLAASIIAQVMGCNHPKQLVLNMNFPSCPEDQIEGIAVTRLGLRVYRDSLVEREDPRGRNYYWIGGEAPTGVADPGTDIWALANNFVSITPLSLDLTDKGMLATLEAWDIKLKR
ncbi:MAG: 5'/3'-nucleotidase SurE [Anaerolineales bacterium]|nr:5'/3'-nucleotidase SurE [Anaerolineales bacterium]